MKRYLCIVFIIATFRAQNIPAEFTNKLNSILSDSLFNRSVIAFDIYDLTDNKRILSRNENLLLRPASNMKLFTSAAALLYLKSNYYFETKFYIDGEIIDSVLNGNLIVEGGYDPDYKTGDLDTVVSSVKKLGIKKINGKLIADVSNSDSLFWGRGWMWDDNPGGFQPYLSPLSINRNTVEIIYKPAKIGEHAFVNHLPKTSYFILDNSLITTGEDTSDIKIERDWLRNNNEISVTGDISFKRKVDTSDVNVIRPELYFLTLLEEKLAQNGISFEGILDTGKLNVESRMFYIHKTPLLGVLRELNTESNNLVAENIILAMSKEFFNPSYSSEKGLRMIDSLAVRLGHNPDEYIFADGSGLSFYNLVSVRLITDLLKYLYYEEPDKYFHLFKSLATAGKTGTLENRMKRSRCYNKLNAKTGTLSGVSALSGYLTTGKNHLLVFSIMIQNYSGKPKPAREIQDNICELLAEYF